MDLEIKKYVVKQSQLEKQIEELLTEKKMLQNRISVLNDCLSLEKIQKKISDLENKQKLLNSLEIMVNQIRAEVKPLDYLKELLKKYLTISTLSTTTNNDHNVEEQKCLENSQLTTNSECAIETLDSLSDVGSEGSVMVLSDYDVVTDEEFPNISENALTNKVMYDEALQMATSVHSILVESPTANVESIRPLPNVNDQNEEMNCIQSNIKKSDILIDTCSSTEKCSHMLSVVNKEDCLKYEKDINNISEKSEMGLEIDKEKIESITQTNIESVGPLPNVNDQKKDINCAQSKTKDCDTLMDTYNSIGNLLNMLNIVNKEDHSKCEKDIIDFSEKFKMGLGIGKEKIESITQINAESVEPSPNDNDQKKDINSSVQSNNKDSDVSSMSISSKIEQLLEMYNAVNNKELINSTENAKMKLGSDKGKIESIIHSVSKLSLSEDILDDVGMNLLDNNKHDYVLKSVSDSWVKVETNELLDSPKKTEHLNGISQINSGPQKDNAVPKVNIDVNVETKNDKLCNYLFESIGNGEIKNLDNVISNDVDGDLKNVDYNPVCSVNDLRDDVIKVVTKSLSNTKCSNIPVDCSEPKVNTKVENHVQKDQPTYSTELNGNSEVNHIQNALRHNLDHNNFKNDMHNPACLTNDLKDKIEIYSSLLSNKYENNESKVSTGGGIHEQNDYLCSNLTEPKENFKVKNYENVDNDMDDNLKNEVNNSICLADDSRNLNASETALLCTGLLSIPSEPNLSIKLELREVLDDFITLGLKTQLSNGIYYHGYERLMTLQQQCIPHCINGRDIVLHSYPCAGKSTMCLISVLQRINTSFNECQAIILVPTVELALFTQKTIKSLGKYLNVSTCIGGTNVPRKVSPVPHVVISTPQDLCDMINSNSLCKDFIKMLVIDDADEMIKSIWINKIRHIILFLKIDRQLIILSTSKLEEILDHFSDTMQNPEYIIIPDEKPSMNDILQYYVNVPDEWKLDALYELYCILNLKHTVVYCNTWNMCLRITEHFRLKKSTVSAVHNDMDTYQRRLMLCKFRSDMIRLLVTPGLLRGEEFSEVIWVINYDFPEYSEDYIRRIVGCFSRMVRVINFITPNDREAKANVEIAFNTLMLRVPRDITKLI